MALSRRALSRLKFSRRVAADKRDKKFALAPLKSARKSRTWDESEWAGDQGNTPQCVGYAWSHWLHSAPVRQWLNPAGIYQLAQFRDEWDGEDYEGTSVRGAAKVLADLGLISEYRWALTIEALVYALLEKGPVVVGTSWREGMLNPDADGAWIRATGEDYGGHAYLLSGVNTTKKFFRIKNSWGTGWGEGGRAYIAFADFERLLTEDGEACLAIEAKPKPS